MQVKGLDGKLHNWKLSGHLNNSRTVSSNHSEVRTLLKAKFPFDLILEEVYLPGSKLFCDFYVPNYKLMIEVHGEQHYKFTPFFHKTRLDFLKGQKRDRDKEEWAISNGITFIKINATKNIQEQVNLL